MFKNRAAVLGYVFLTVLLTAGTAHSLAGTNTVTTDDIVDHNITAADLGTNSVTRPALGDNAVGSTEVANGSLTGSDVKDGSLTSSDLAIHKVYTTRIRDTGARFDGDAESASLTTTGNYTVTFGFDVTPCSASVEASRFTSDGAVAVNAVTSAWTVGDDDPDTVQVFIYNAYNQPPAAQNSNFVLTLVCP